jgi:hypothetical protein
MMVTLMTVLANSVAELAAAPLGAGEA